MSTACLAPNGMTVYPGAAPATRLLVGTAKGIVVFERAPGTDWRVTGSALDGHHISSMASEPVRGGLFAGVHRGGVFYSPDQGRSWEERSHGISIPHVYSLAAAAENGLPVLYAGTEPASAFVTRDEGRHWEELPGFAEMKGKEKWDFPMPPHLAHAKAITIDPRHPEVIYVGVEQGGLFKTNDGGRTWRELDSYWTPEDEVYRDIHQCVLRPNHPDEVYMTSGMGLYRSEDGGDSWVHLTERVSRLGYPDKLIFSPSDDRTMFMCGAKANPGTWITLHSANAAVLVSRDLGENWIEASAGMPEPMTANLEAMCLSAGPHGFELFTGTTDGCVYCSDDEAQSWRCIGGNLPPVSKVEHFRLLLPGAVSSRGARGARPTAP